MNLDVYSGEDVRVVVGGGGNLLLTLHHGVLFMPQLPQIIKIITHY